MERLNILNFGADSSGCAKSTAAIQAAIDKCPIGGTVYIPAGKFVSGALFCKSDMTLYIEAGAVLKGSGDTADYPIKRYRWEGEETDCYSSLINAGIDRGELHNFSIDGAGTIDANGVELFLKERKEQKGARGRAVCIINGENINIRGITIRQSPAWCLHLIRCCNVKIDGITVHTRCDENGVRYAHIFNGDGIDCDSCRFIEITNSYIASQDDCIAIKSGKNAEGRAAALPSEHILIENCKFGSGFGVAIGSEMSGDVRCVTVRNCSFRDTFSIGSIKTCRGRGGVIEDILFENVDLVNTSTEFHDCEWFRGGIYVDSYYSNVVISKEMQPVSEETPLIRNITFRNASVDTCGGNAVYVSGLPELYCENISLENISAVGTYGMKAYFTKGLRMLNVSVKAREGSDYLFENVQKEVFFI